MRKFIPVLLLSFILLMSKGFCGDTPQYGTNPFSFSFTGSPYWFGDHFFMIDLNGDGHLDFTYRTEWGLYAYDHYGTLMWVKTIQIPEQCHGATFAAADIDGDSQVEVLALNRSNEIIVYDGYNGNPEDTIDVNVGAYQRLGHIAVVNLRGAGDRDVIVQTMDTDLSGYNFYINRTLIAMNVESTTVDTLWRVKQNRAYGDGYYEGYWGQAHGGLMCADVDGDGLDEVVGGNYIDDDGTFMDVNFPYNWVHTFPPDYMDHLDCVAVGDFLPNTTDLEWVITNEDHQDGGTGYWDWYTSMLSTSDTEWQHETTLFSEGSANNDREPQHVAVGNFDTESLFSEIWVRSRFGDPLKPEEKQHPWVLNSSGVQFTHYEMDTTLPAGFNINGNKMGLELIWTIDWFGTKKEYIAGTTRGSTDGHVGIFDAVTGDSIWTTMDRASNMQCKILYVADVSGDSREEIVVMDLSDNTIKVFWNGEVNTNQPKPDKWDDPLYARVKQNWGYYSPGSYTYGDYPIISDIAITEITADSVTITWTTDEDSDSQVEYGESTAYGSETTLDPTLTASHSVKIHGLDPGTEYHFRVKSGNEYNKLGMSADSTFETDFVLLQARILLEGPFVTGKDSMNSVLNQNDYIPLTSPYTEDPRTVSSIPPLVTDWVLVQLRSTHDGSALVSRSAFLHRDGRIVTDDAASGEIILGVDDGSYYIVIRHRNHLAVMSKITHGLNGTGSTLYNFTDDTDRYYGDEAALLDSGVYGMFAGDGNYSGVVTIADGNLALSNRDAVGYYVMDYNMSGIISVSDVNLSDSNRDKTTQVE
jgi:hypothetical protein